MARHATFKDIIYALQYAHEELIFIPAEPPKRKSRWRLSISGIEVEDAIAEKFRASGQCEQISEHRWGWKSAA